MQTIGTLSLFNVKRQLIVYPSETRMKILYAAQSINAAKEFFQENI